jgi:hypothetical protein
MTLDDHMATVNGLVRTYERATETNPNHAPMIPKLRELAEYLAEQKRLAAPIPRALGDISDLPEELIRELSIQKTDELDDQILTVMRACDGEAGLDQVLVGLYRKFKVVQTRRFLQNKLYRMAKKELIYQIPGQRAAYSLDPQSGSGDPPRVNRAPRVDESARPSQRLVPGDPDYDPLLDDEIPF